MYRRSDSIRNDVLVNINEHYNCRLENTLHPHFPRGGSVVSRWWPFGHLFYRSNVSSLEGVSLVAEHGKRYLYASQIPQSQYELEKNISVIRLLRKNKQYKNKRQKSHPNLDGFVCSRQLSSSNRIRWLSSAYRSSLRLGYVRDVWLDRVRHRHERETPLLVHPASAPHRCYK